MTPFFSEEEVITLNALENKLIEKVYYHFWVNQSKPNEVFQSLDYIQLVFSDGSHLYFSAKEKEGISIAKPELEKERAEVKQEFGNKIFISSQEVTTDPLWIPATSQALEYIALRKGKEHHYLNDALLLNFGDYEILIYHEDESLLVEQMIDDEDDMD